jgi:hypothetical protein
MLHENAELIGRANLSVNRVRNQRLALVLDTLNEPLYGIAQLSIGAVCVSGP